MGDLSEHFDSSEFVDRRTGGIILPTQSFVSKLEDLRDRIGRPLPIVSGYRSPSTNRLVGGARRSWHLHGRAVDIPKGLVSVDQAVGAGFTGIGRCGAWVVHLDDRPRRSPLVFKDC